MVCQNKINAFFKSALISIFLITSCQKEDINPSPLTLEVNEFIWTNMEELYLWNDYLPQNIDRDREFDSETYFEKLLFKPTDRWSFITDDHAALINSFKGIEKSFGHNFKLFLLPNSNNLIGIVKYVVPGSPAELAEITRGDIFYKVNGNTLNPDNYYELLFERESYLLSFGEFDPSGQLTPTEDKSLSSVVIAENPIFIDKTIDYEGYKIGYLAYNQFIVDYNESLVEVFRKFQSDGVQDLVLDLRYNPGGSINTAILLSSMIAPAPAVENKEIFSRLIWNEELTNYFLEEEGEESDNLVSTFITTEVNLNLNKVYILISSNSASASELVINCLAPYMEVILIGSDNTTGKYVGSITIDDEESDHGWAIQPIVLKTANAIGISDYSNGFAPEYVIDDDFNAALGTLEEDMLAKSIELITGKVITEPGRIAASSIPKNMISISSKRDLNKQNMYLEISNK